MKNQYNKRSTGQARVVQWQPRIYPSRLVVIPSTEHGSLRQAQDRLLATSRPLLAQMWGEERADGLALPALSSDPAQESGAQPIAPTWL